MNMHRIFSGTGGTIALVCILFLPIVGCGGENVTGLQVIQSNNIPGNIKVFVGLAALAGLVVIFLRQYLAALVTSICGAISLLVAYIIAQRNMSSIELKVGAFFALIGFAMAAVANFLKRAQESSDTSRK